MPIVLLLRAINVYIYIFKYIYILITYKVVPHSYLRWLITPFVKHPFRWADLSSG